MKRRKQPSSLFNPAPRRRRRRPGYSDDIFPFGVGVLLGATLVGAVAGAANS